MFDVYSPAKHFFSSSLSATMSVTEEEFTRDSHMHTDGDEDEEEEEDDDVEEEEEEWKEESPQHKRGGGFFVGKMIDPRAKYVQEWNRLFLLVCGMGLFVDPLFFYTLSISDPCMCLFVDGWFAITITVLRCMTDAFHLWNMWLQFRMVKRSGGFWSTTEMDKVRSMTPRSVALKYLKAKNGFFLDLFVILPLLQVLALI